MSMLIYLFGCSRPSNFVVFTSKDNLESTTSFVDHLDSEYFQVEENAKQRESCRSGQILLWNHQKIRVLSNNL